MKKVEKVSLNGKWNLKHTAKSINIIAQVPGSIFEALIENKIIVDPFHGTNEHKVSWVFKTDWFYELNFDIDTKILEYSKVFLRFNGLDTISEVYLNNELIGSTDNMFISYDFDVKQKLKVKNNELKVLFKSPTKTARQLIKKYRKKLRTTHGFPGLPYLRKAQYSFGWDWGPALPDIGIWKTVELIAYDDVKINAIYPIQIFKYNKNPLNIENPAEIPDINVELVKLQLNIDVDSNCDGITSLNYKISINITAPDGTKISKIVDLKSHKQIVEFEINNPQLWWTHDLGKQNLYELEVIIQNSKEIDTHRINIGLRDIKLIRKSDKWGECFYFLLNGVPIFAKGANWVPIDCFLPRGKRLGLYQMNLKYAKEANMNMLRVWGGGIYEDDLFYDICDEEGILIWQDFPFACAIYPINKEFFDNVRKEAIQNIKRLRHHASLALLCGNNEIEQLWPILLLNANLWRDRDKEIYEKAYLDIFKGLIPELIKEHDPQHPYWPSSALDLWDGKKIRSKNPNGPNKGDSHFWKVWHGGAPFKSYRKFDSRFMSEFGFESFPSMKTIKKFCPIEQYFFDSPIMDNHQKNPGGNRKIIRYMRRRFSNPEEFQKQVILSQITQAEAIEYGVDHWRQNRNEFHCMGSLYWQLNDCWPVISWSSIDYSGCWKALHYFAKRFYQPFFASVKEEKNYVEFWLTNDLRVSRKGILEWKILNSNNKLLMDGSFKSGVPPCSSIKMGSIDVSSINKEKEQMQNNIIFYSLRDKNKLVIFRGFRLFGAPKSFDLKDPELTYEFKRNVENKRNRIEYKLEIKSKYIALYVFIESNIVDFVASDNFFSLEPTESRKITLKIKNELEPIEKLEINKIQDLFKVRSLYDLIYK